MAEQLASRGTVTIGSASPTFAAFPGAARIAATLLHDPAVAASWTEPSALAGFRVSGLAGHLASQVIRVIDLLAHASPTGDAVDVLGHYERVPWIGLDVLADVSTNIRDDGERLAAVGAQALAAQVDAATAALPELLATVPPSHVVALPWTTWSLTADGLLLTRMLEIVIHGDDLAVSVGLPTPAFPPEVLRPVLGVLTDLAVARHGQGAVLRALARVERAPRHINAM